MAKIQFENGVTVDFAGDPTPDDIEEVAQKLNIHSYQPASQKSLGSKVIDFGKGALSSMGSTAARLQEVTSPTAQLEGTINKGLEDLTGLKPISSFDIYTVIKNKFGKNKVTDFLDKIFPAEGKIGTLIPGTEIETKYSSDPMTQLKQRGEDVLNAGVPFLPKGTGKVLKGAGEVTYKSAIVPTAKEAEQILAYKAKTPFLERLSSKVTEGKPVLRADTAFEKGIKGTESQLGIQSKRVSDKLWTSKIAPAVKESKEVVTKQELFTPIEKRIAGTTDPSKKKALQEAYSAIKDDYKKVSQFTLEQAQKLKSELDEFTPEKIFRGKNVANEFKVLQNDMANAIRSKTYTALKDQNIQRAYRDWGNLKELQKVGVRAISEGRFQGGAGNFWHGLWDMATVPVKTVGGRVLYRVGDALEFIGEKGITKFGTFLTKQGFKKPRE